MKPILTGLMVCIAAIGVAEKEWTPLFDGKSFEGWTFDVKDDVPPDTIWEIKDGTVVVNGKGNSTGIMRTVKSYTNYELEFEWQWPDTKGNSGCLIHCSTPREIGIWPKSIEVQLMAEQAGDFWLIGESIEVNPDQIAPSKKGQPSRRRLNLTDDSEKPLGEWNTMRIITKGSSVEVFVNGTLVQKGWNASVTEGAIGLQSEKANIQFRNIRIRQ